MKKIVLIFSVLFLPFLAAAQCNTNVANTCTCKDGTSNCDLLPDITLARATLEVPGTGGIIEYPQVCNPPCSGNDGRLRVSVSTPNIGFGPLEVNALDTVICGTDTISHPPAGFTCPNGQTLKQLVMQRVYHKNGNVMTSYLRPAGTMTYHPSHGHMHVDDWGIYTLRTATADPNPLNWPIIGTGAKLAFCLMDYGTCSTYNGHCMNSSGQILTNDSFPNMGLGGGQFNCDPKVQGISSGFTDIYYQHLDGMWINLPAGLCNGNYWIVVNIDPRGYFLESNENNNVIAVPVTLTQQSGVKPKITANGPTTFCQGGSVTLTSSSSTNYLWSTGATTQSIVVTQSGIYTVTTNTTGVCPTASDPVEVVVNPIVINAAASPNSICASQQVQLTSSAVNNGFFTQSLALTNSNSVTIPDNNGNGATSSITVSGLSPSTLAFNSIVSVKINISHTADGDLMVQLISPSGNTINLSSRRGGTGNNFTNTIFSAGATTAISAGSPPYTGTFLPEAAFSALTGNLNGDWKLKVKDLSGGDAGSILNWTLTLNRTLPTTLTYAWTSVPAGFTSSSSSVNVTPSVSTNYTVTINESGTGCSGSKTVAVTVGNNLDVTTNTPNAICAGQSTTLTANGATNYTWSPSTGLSATTGSSVTASPTSTTTYRVIGTNGSCSDTAFVQVIVNSLPLVTVNSPAPICAGQSVNLIAGGANSYSWSPATGLDAITGSSVNASPSGTTTYQLTGTSNGCSATIPVTVNVNQLPNVTVSQNQNICSGDQVGLTAGGGTTYIWSPAIGLSATTGANVIASPTTTTTYQVTGTTNNCSSNASVTITVNQKPEAPSINQISASFCSPVNTSFSVNPVANTTGYTWNVPAGVTIGSGQGTTQISISSSQAVNGNICVTADNNCGHSIPSCIDMHVFTTAPVQPPVVISSLAKVCPGNLVTYNIPLMADATAYLWGAPANAIIQSGQGSNSITVQFNAGYAGGNITVKGINTCGTGVTRYKGAQLNIPATPGNISGLANVVCSSTQTYSVNNVSGMTYNWSVPVGANILSGQGSNSVSVQFNGSFIPGNINVSAQNGCGTSSARSKLLTGSPKQAASISGPASVCINQTGVTYYTPIVAGVTSYNWAVTASGATIMSGQGTNSVLVDFGNKIKNLSLKVALSNSCGTAIYKFTPVAINGCAKVTDFDNNGLTLTLHPNPAKEYVEALYNSDNSADGILSITNILGQVKYKQVINPAEGQNSYMVDLRKLPAGVYMLSIIQDNHTYTQRLIVE